MIRREFCALEKLKHVNLRQRVFTGEAAFAEGRAAPASRNEYSEMDAAATLLSSMLHGLGKIPLASAAAVVRDNWEEWSAAWQVAERERLAEFHEQMFFGFGTTRRGKHVAACGLPQEALAAVEARGGVCEPRFFLPLNFVSRVLRQNATEAGLLDKLPRYIMPEPAAKAREPAE